MNIRLKTQYYYKKKRQNNILTNKYLQQMNLQNCLFI